MENNTNNTDKMQRMINTMTLTGRLAELTVREGETKKKIPYVSLKGKVQFGDHKAQMMNFEAMAMAYSEKENDKKEIEKKEIKNYSIFKKWAENAVPMTKAPNMESATEVSMVGNLVPNDYVGSDEQLHEANKFVVSFFNEIDKTNEEKARYKCINDVEGYLLKATREIKNDEETGRIRATVITNNFKLEAIPVSFIVPADLADDFEEAYEIGCTALFYLEHILHKGEAKKVKAGGLGVQRVTEGRSYTELTITGASPVYEEDDEKTLSRTAVKIAMAERKAMLEELKEKGYQGSSSNAASAPKVQTDKNGFIKTSAADDDIPF